MDTATAHNDIPRLPGDIPDYPREKADDHPEKIHDGISNCTEEEKRRQREKCREDVGRLNPGLDEKAQREYDAMDDVERDVLHAYTMRDLYGINAKLLNFYLATIGKAVGRLSEFISQTDFFEIERRQRILDKLPKFFGTVYRGMSFTDEKTKKLFVKNWKDGQSPLTGFVSTTYNEDKAGLYLKEGQEKVILVMHDTKDGAYVGHLSSTPMDEEILFSCNQKFRMMSEEELGHPPTYDQNGVTYIHVTEA